MVYLFCKLFRLDFLRCAYCGHTVRVPAGDRRGIGEFGFDWLLRAHKMLCSACYDKAQTACSEGAVRPKHTGTRWGWLRRRLDAIIR